MHFKLHFIHHNKEIFHKHIFKSLDNILRNCTDFKMIGTTYPLKISKPYQAKV